jgi:hypothetical protein
MPARAAIAVVLVLLSPSAFALDPQLAALAMPGAKVLAGANVEQAKGTPFGVYVLARLAGSEASLQRLKDATGFDPREDVVEILVASTGETAGGHPSGLVLVRGSFDATLIAAAARAKGLQPETYNGITVIDDKRQRGSVAFVAPDLAVVGSPAEVRAAVDRRGTPTSLDAALADRASQLSAAQDVWVVSSVMPSFSNLPDPTLQGIIKSGVLAGLQQSSAGVKFGANVDITAEAVAATAQDAASLAAVVRLLATMAQGRARGSVPSTLLESLTVTTSGNAVQLALSIPQSLVEQLASTPREARPLTRRRR